MSLPADALEAAKEAMREVTPPPGVSKADWLSEHGTWALFAGAIAAAAPFIAAQALTDAATDLQASVDIIRVRSYNAGIDNDDTLHAMTTDVGWLQHRADELRTGPPVRTRNP
ncbi:hypothetical protein Achl_4257 (plasmid) [Pseudarthrobacter chlorophenolicus A6]|uniref:Uncharacterized protein n=1 Tax=Pseudarthrobacter chlorophenolicus (strain ATCC 700700 / DSM 12829 / CIP 107037 / JCM 12360 / KCTC 9906 / NCIMB 13794 / A6) TaxID=452863 RepID=B8HIG1_PSECP|nr:hypothetical protein [Pseudarthrobacter chlorophenolicus]ACL42208.1 hypothetical protein Achl_4257 [Pseudarthrobacter chlorophenolicus A6]SDQ14901.1 hypothetical protein SAMN04489738_0315 [Pseudarthrobacter chlorophenolicus]